MDKVDIVAHTDKHTHTHTYIYIYIHTYVYICIRGYRSVIKKNEIMAFVAIWMDLEIIILNDVSQTKANI